MLYTDEAIKKRIEKKNRCKKRIITLVYILVIPILIYNMSLIIQAVINPSKTPSLFGIKTYVIISGSMEPELNIGDIVIAKSIKEEEIEKGDIICFRQGQSVVTHRVSGILETSNGIEYKTKGDNNNTEDSQRTSFDMIEGKVIKKVQKIGKLSLVFKGKMLIIFIVIIIYADIIWTSKKKKNSRRLKRLEYENRKK